MSCIRKWLLTAWGVLGACLAFVFAGPNPLLWLIVVGVPWLIGLVLLAAAPAGRLQAAAGALLESQAVAFAAIPAVALVVLGVQIFSLDFVLWALTWMGLVAISLATLGRVARLRETFLGTALAAVTVLLTGWVTNRVLNRSAVADRWGSPQVMRAWDSRYGQLWRHNIFGLRSPYERAKKPPGTVRVLALGDSFTWGDKIVSADSVWPARLEGLLRLRDPKHQIQVVNAGMRGFTTANEGEMLHRVGWRYHPDLVLVQWLANDPWPSGPDFAHKSSRDMWPQPELLPYRFRTGWFGTSTLYAFLKIHIDRLLHPLPAATTRFGRFFVPTYPGFRQMKAALTSMGTEAHAHGVPIVLVIWPMALPGRWTAADYPMRGIQREVKRLAEADGFHVLDLTGAFAQALGPANWRTLWATPYDAHPSVAADAIAARAIEDYLIHRSWAAHALGTATAPSDGF